MVLAFSLPFMYVQLSWRLEEEYDFPKETQTQVCKTLRIICDPSGQSCFPGTEITERTSSGGFALEQDCGLPHAEVTMSQHIN